MSNNHARFQGKCHHCRKYEHREVDCWEKYVRPRDKQEKNNQAAKEVTDNKEQVTSVAFYVEDDDESQESQEYQYDP